MKEILTPTCCQKCHQHAGATWEQPPTETRSLQLSVGEKIAHAPKLPEGICALKHFTSIISSHINYGCNNFLLTLKAPIRWQELFILVNRRYWSSYAWVPQTTASLGPHSLSPAKHWPHITPVVLLYNILNSKQQEEEEMNNFYGKDYYYWLNKLFKNAHEHDQSLITHTPYSATWPKLVCTPTATSTFIAIAT